MNMKELEGQAVCCVSRAAGSMFILEIRGRFWPYHRQNLPGRSGPEVEFVQKARDLFMAPACIQTSFSAADERIAEGLYRRGISIEQITPAILLGCARKYVAMINAGVHAPIASLQYFADIIDEVEQSAIPRSYSEPLRAKVTRMEQKWPYATVGSRSTNGIDLVLAPSVADRRNEVQRRSPLISF
jgi:hypothetical protein